MADGADSVEVYLTVFEGEGTLLRDRQGIFDQDRVDGLIGHSTALVTDQMEVFVLVDLIFGLVSRDGDFDEDTTLDHGDDVFVHRGE